MITMLASMLMTAPVAEAGPAVGVGLVTLGGETVGVIGGGLLGAGLGAASCGRGTFECYGPLIGLGLGAVAGGVAGGLGGSALSARVFRVRGPRPTLFALGGLGVGATLMVVGQATNSSALFWGGAVVGALGMPVGATLGTLGAESRTGRRRSAALLPMTGRAHGVRFVANW